MDRRTFLTAAAALAAAAPQAWADPAVLMGEARRLSGTELQLDWNAKTSPVAVYVSSDPDAPSDFMHRMEKAARGGMLKTTLAVAPRPYFLLASADGHARVAERLLPLQGGRNFRDLGGYRADDGRQVRWGRLYRSGVMAGLTPADIRYLAALNLRVVCDLRDARERGNEPSPFLALDAPQVVSFDYDLGGSLGRMEGAKSREEAIDAFAESYVAFLEVLTPQYRDMFDRLAHAEFPLAMNCSAGKDRTGMGSALLLSVLGVPRESVVADYALTQVYTPPAYYRKMMAQGGMKSSLSPQQAEAFSRMPPDVLDTLMGSDPEIMRRALARIDSRFGGPVALAKARFGLTDARIAQMRALYLI